MSKIKRLAGETVLYGLGTIIPRFLNFLMLPLYTAVFAPEEFSVIAKLYAYVGVINTIFMFGMETAYFRFANKPGENEQRIFNITQSVVIGISGVFSTGFILFATPIAVYLEISARPDLVTWLALIMFIDALVAIPFARLRFQKKALPFATAKLANILLVVGLNLYFLKIAFDHPDVGLVVLANLIGNAFYILFFLKTLFSWRPLYDRKISPVIFQYAFPIMLSGLAGMTNEMFSRITLEEWLPENFYPGKSQKFALGVFSACYRFAGLMNIAITAFRYAAEPFLFAQSSEKNSPQLFARINHYFIVFCCLLLLGVSINLDILRHFLAKPAYWEGLHIVPILLLAYLFLGVYYNFSVWFKLTDRTYYGTLITVGGAIITIAANYLLIPLAGYEGSSWAALLCYLSMAFACYVLGQKYFPIPYNLVKAIAYIVLTLMIVYGTNAVHFQQQFTATLFHALVLGIFCVLVYVLERRDFKSSPA
jgi:O-antigen/teichoic acid export membrane protein